MVLQIVRSYNKTIIFAHFIRYWPYDLDLDDLVLAGTSELLIEKNVNLQLRLVLLIIHLQWLIMLMLLST